jgi:hypothetical protein
MALTTEELIESLQNEVRILLHLATKIDRNKLDYRPSAKQRSIIELLRYMSIMGPGLVTAIKTGNFDGAAWGTAAAAAEVKDFDAILDDIGKQSEMYAAELGSMSDAEITAPLDMFGRSKSRGAHMVNLVLCGHAAYRTQLFLYLKACGREELNTMNLWGGMDNPQ